MNGRPRVVAIGAALALAVGVGALGAWSGRPAPAQEPVTTAEARATVRSVVDLAAERTPEALTRLCAANGGCTGLSGGVQASDAPGPADPPEELCIVALPPTPEQGGAQLVVVAGTDGTGRDYVSQLLVERDEDGRTVVAEPAFWIGTAYDALQRGRSWSALADDPEQRAAHDERASHACTDTEAWLAEVT